MNTLLPCTIVGLALRRLRMISEESITEGIGGLGVLTSMLEKVADAVR